MSAPGVGGGGAEIVEEATSGVVAGTSGQAPVAIPRDDLVLHYEAYRVRQARALIGLLPRDAIRPLYRRARKAAGATVDEDDPMAVLVAHCESLLPLPPFEVWLEDLERWPDAHWREVEASPDAPSSASPVTIDTRRFRHGLESWTARLRGFRDQDAWRGFITFQRDEDAPADLHRTALIFREPTLTDLRDRFRGFENASLEAFLRSALP